MTNEQIYLVYLILGASMLFSTVLVGLLWFHVNIRFKDTKDIWLAELERIDDKLKRFEEAIDDRLKRLEEK